MRKNNKVYKIHTIGVFIDRTTHEKTEKQQLKENCFTQEVRELQW